jgi:glycosyltransferase involved in cell wall biosynthesis
MLSMIFVLREVLQLRKLGFRIDVASINAADRQPRDLTQAEAGEAARTYYIKPDALRGAPRAHAKVLLSRPSRYLAGWALAFRLGGSDVKALFYQLMYLTEALMVGVWMQRVGQRHLHVHLGSQPATVGLYVKEVFGFGLSITVHGPDEFYEASVQHLREKVIAADFICCISHFARSQLMKLSPYAHWHKLVVSRLGIDPSVFQPVEPPSGRAHFEILCVGRLTSAKGQHLLVDAVGTMHRQGRRVRLRIVGGGDDRASLEAQVRSQQLDSVIIFEGPVNQDAIRALYAQADCFCIASFAEGIPVVLMEAMAMQIPCVTTHITGIPELIRHKVEGLLVAPSDSDGLVQELSRLMDDPALRRELGANARQRVLESYDLARNVDLLAQIMRERVAS